MKPRCPDDKPPGIGLYEWILLCAASERLRSQQQAAADRIEREAGRLMPAVPMSAIVTSRPGDYRGWSPVPAD